MRFELLTEGKAEKRAVRGFLHRALNARLGANVGVSITRFRGNADYLRKAPDKARKALSARDADEIVAVIGLLDLYGLPADWQLGSSSDDRHRQVKAKIEGQVSDRRFRQFFAVHESEAWLLSDVAVFPTAAQPRLRSLGARPERVDLDHGPARRIDDAYLRELNRGYRKVTDGQTLFSKLEPAAVLDKCPYFRAMIEEMVELAQAAGT